MSDKPAVLVLGGTGCVGRNLVKMLVESGQFSKIRVADKKMPITSFLSDEYKAIFDNPIVEFKQVNLSNGGTWFAFCFSLSAKPKHFADFRRNFAVWLTLWYLPW